MIMEIIKDHIDDNEMVIIQTRMILSRKNKRFVYITFISFGLIGTGLILFACFNPYIYMDMIIEFKWVMFIGSFILGLLFLTMFMFFVWTEFRDSRIIYVFTTKRMIKLFTKKLLFREKIKKQIDYLDISHVLDYGIALEIIPNKEDGTGYFKGDETEISHKIGSRKLNFVKILLQEKKGVDMKYAILDLLKEKVPLQMHPNLRDVYFNNF